MLKLIAAIGPNGEMGYKGKLPWHISEDLKFFQTITLYSNVVMGRKTFQSLPGHGLKLRNNFVLSNKYVSYSEKMDNGYDFYQINNFSEVYNPQQIYWIIGGAQIYNYFLDKWKDEINEAYITCVNRPCKADTYFPLKLKTILKRVELVKSLLDDVVIWRYF